MRSPGSNRAMHSRIATSATIMVLSSLIALSRASPLPWLGRSARLRTQAAFCSIKASRRIRVGRLQGKPSLSTVTADARLDGQLSSSTVATGEALPSSRLRWRCNPDQFDFQTTEELEPLKGLSLLGQARAESAIKFGVNMPKKGYNLYILGPPGSGKRTAISNYLENHPMEKPPAADWAYVHNFHDPDHPKALKLPAGMGTLLRDDLSQLVEDIQVAIPAAMESQEHRAKIQQVQDEIFLEHQLDVERLKDDARKDDLMLIRSPQGLVLAGPASNPPADKEGNERALPLKKQASIRKAIEKLQPRLDDLIQRYPQLKKLELERVKDLNKKTTETAIEFLFSPLKAKYSELPDVLAHLGAVEANVVERSEDIHYQQEEDDEQSIMATLMSRRRKPVPFHQYNINLIVNNNETLTTGAPVINEENPTFYNLVGRTEHLSQLGTFMTDFSLIKAGALHRANGGYLVLNARDVLMQPYSWEALKRCIRLGAVKIEALGAEYGLISTATLQPEPIDLDVKVILLGDRLLYYLLCDLDPDFDELFKVAADFNDEMDRSSEACVLFAQMLATLTESEDLKPLDQQAVAAMIEQAARQVGDQERLSTHLRSSSDLLCESDYWAKVDDAKVIAAKHVHKAIDQQIYRADRVRELIYDEIRRGTFLVDVEGSHIGQINGLSVMALGNLAFGRPSRITATTRMGKGQVVDIEREVELGGALHSKGVMILSSLLSSRYALDCPLCLSANLVFEQSYGMVDGDSASMAELVALLSSLAQVPIQQRFAITGSVNQFGEAQPIGGVTEKIEGFFDICKTKDLTGNQGVLIPVTNVKHLMLRPDVLEAVDQGKFAVYSYKNVDEAVALLTETAAGQRGEDGCYPPGTVNYLVDRRLHEYADLVKSFSKDENSDSGKQ